jgi:serine/threonine protein kinase
MLDRRYKQWMQLEYGPAMREGKGNEIVLPLWFFVSSISSLAGSLIVSLLHIDPQQRCTAAEALRHPWSTMVI